jgi:hypothetical protein
MLEFAVSIGTEERRTSEPMSKSALILSDLDER